jgi:phosphatidylserine/phosphatidylglycerophosphate/cardiolipin synthase-like enzyme
VLGHCLTRVIACFLLLVASCDRPVANTASTGTQVGTHGAIAVYFSPRGGCAEAIVQAINQARQTLDIQAYSFTSTPIAQAVVNAQTRGVKIRVVLDDSQKSERYSSATFLKNHNVPVFIDDRHAIAHNKIMIIDSATLITGSFNFSKAAEESNAENVLIIRDNPELIAAYNGNFQAHLAHSLAY